MSNCKQGDIARLVHPALPENKDKLFSVVSPGLFHDWSIEPLSRVHRGDCLGHVVSVPSGLLMECDDWRLRPIRDNDGEDETLTWAGKPARSPLAKVCDPQPVVVGAPAHGEVG